MVVAPLLAVASRGLDYSIGGVPTFGVLHSLVACLAKQEQHQYYLGKS